MHGILCECDNINVSMRDLHSLVFMESSDVERCRGWLNFDGGFMDGALVNEKAVL